MSKHNVETLSDKAASMRRDLREVANGAMDQAEVAASDAVLKARRLSEEAADAAREAKHRLAIAYERTSEGAERAYRGARTYARKNPAMTAAITFASGVGIGLLLAPRRSSEPGIHRSSYRQGLVPIAAMALAHAVIEIFDEQR